MRQTLYKSVLIVLLLALTAGLWVDISLRVKEHKNSPSELTKEEQESMIQPIEEGNYIFFPHPDDYYTKMEVLENNVVYISTCKSDGTILWRSKGIIEYSHKNIRGETVYSTSITLANLISVILGTTTPHLEDVKYLYIKGDYIARERSHLEMMDENNISEFFIAWDESEKE